MESSKSYSNGINALPNELIYSILQPLPTSTLLALTPVSKRFHALTLRILHHRLTTAAGLGDHTLILECYHPSAKLFAGHLYCTSLGTPNLSDSLEPCDPDGNYQVGEVGAMGKLYTRFRPSRKEPDREPGSPTIVRRHPAGDIPGSRTHPSSASQSTQHQSAGSELVAETVSLDAHELFSQLCAVTNLVKIGPRRGLFMSIVEVSDGTIRVWRDWLAGQIGAGRKSAQSSKEGSVEDLTQDPSILWVNNSNNAVGIKFRVRERKWRRDNPILYSAEEEVAVSYYIEFEGEHIPP
ncbi:hypothetical protein H2203_002284 [Taxawa tesnikishii (nom. ined.)]|nr:hypothetical protein H2203_002284 [Dothideales sp. JES 119]